MSAFLDEVVNLGFHLLHPNQQCCTKVLARVFQIWVENLSIMIVKEDDFLVVLFTSFPTVLGLLEALVESKKPLLQASQSLEESSSKSELDSKEASKESDFEDRSSSKRCWLLDNCL